MKIRVSSNQSALRDAVATLRKKFGQFPLQRVRDCHVISAEDATTLARMIFVLEEIGIEIKKMPKPVERAYMRLFKEAPPDEERTEIDDEVYDFDSSRHQEILERAGVVGASVRSII